MYKSYSYNNMPMPVNRKQPEKKETAREKKEETEIHEEKEIKCKEEHGGLLDNIEKDDMIILAVVFVLLMDGCDDKLLLLALAFVLFSDMQ